MKKLTTILILIHLSTIVAQGQIVIGGNVYGGGNKGNVNGSTTVNVAQGDMHKVFGGARMANVGGNAYVNIDGKHASGYMVIDHVYGGNDISGTIGTASAIGKTTMPDEVKDNKDGVTPNWNTYVHISAKNKSENVYYTQEEINAAKEGDDAYGKTIKDIKTPAKVADDNEKIYIGQLFGGGNGDYTYTDDSGNPLTDEYGNYIIKEGDTVVAKRATPFNLPELDKTYVDVQGGSIVYAYGGGNNATVKEKTVIHVDNPSKVVNEIFVNETTLLEDKNATEAGSGIINLLSDKRFAEKMGINMGFSFPSSGDFQIGRFFGGNNMATMDIRPTWNLQNGKIRNLYSGGNRGAMICPEGLLLEIPLASRIVVDNLFGGCRMADVQPTVNGVYAPCKNLTQANYPDADLERDYNFPNELSARVLVRGGDINNVYGGNDVTGKVYGGNAIGIYTSIRGDVYGGGNGAYPYTDQTAMINNDIYGDVYYSTEGYTSSIDALNAFRPNAEQVSIRLAGTANKPTLIRGSVYVGGNCATLATVKNNPLVELKIGSYVIADKVFLGNNGEKMVDPTILGKYAETSFSTLYNTFTDPSVFSSYMEGIVMTLHPDVVFDSKNNGDPADYIDYSSYIGSFYFGGNVGSMAIPGKNTYTIMRGLNIFDKFVGGCNNANVAAADGLNAAYEGGVLGSEDERSSYTDDAGKIKDRLEINLENLTMVPKRWNSTMTALEWNTNKWFNYLAVANGTTLTAGNTYYTSDAGAGEFTAEGTEVADGTNYYEKLQDFASVPKNASDDAIRLLGGNVYGGCYNSGHVNGNVTININQDLLKRDEVFGEDNSGVELENQRDDLDALAMTVFGAGYGENTEIWGSTTVNLNRGYAFQVFGGGEQGVVGKKTIIYDEHNIEIGREYKYNPAYNSTVNLNGKEPIYSSDEADEDLAEAEYLYGGGNEGDVSGNTLVNLGHGRIYDAFGGACDADILGHSEVYVGRQPKGDGTYIDGFPWVRDIVYGGNDFGGKIHGNFEDSYDFTKRVRDYDTYKSMIHGYTASEIPDVLKGTAYVEYLQGRVDTIFGGSYGYYDYTNTALYGVDASMPKQESAYVNVRPNTNANNAITAVFGAGTGYPGVRSDDGAQDRSYVLIDIPQNVTNFERMEVFGAGSYNGVGMGVDKAKLDNSTIALDKASAIIDLLHGNIGTAFGGSYNEGVTRRTVVNVPKESTIKIKDIFGGAFGTQILPPCDVYESNVNYHNTSENALVTGAIYGGNNNERRTLYTHVNISSPVWSNKESGWLATVYGAGNGIDTWSEHTEVNLKSGAKVYDVYGGGRMGHVLNSKSIQAYMQMYKDKPSLQVSHDDAKWKQSVRWTGEVGSSSLNPDYLGEWHKDWKDAWTLGTYYVPDEKYDNYLANDATNLTQVAERTELDDKTAALLDGKKYNTNVIINEGAEVVGYAYGGGLGDASVALSGDVYGTTYIALLGGTVKKDVYAAGKAGGIDNLFDTNSFSNEEERFTATANAYIQGGTCRNVYGGGYLGHVGHHDGGLSDNPSGDRLAEAHVVIGEVSGTKFTDGVPAITRNVYGGGEGGSVYGSSYVTLRNGYVGYRYKNTGTENSPKYEYLEELDDKKTNDLDLSGNVFGGGYIINSYVDKTYVDMYGGTVRGSLYGGGELGPIGRGTMKSVSSVPDYALQNGDATIFKAGQTHVKMYNGHVMRNVFGGGRGKDSWGGDGTMYMDAALVATLDMKSKGFVFGQTDVNIYGGEIGSSAGLARDFGNVFGGGDEGSVYSAYEQNGTLYVGKKSGERYKDSDEGYYYRYNGSSYVNAEGTAISGSEKYLTEDCHVLVEPWLQTKAPITYNSKEYASGDYIPTSYLNTLPKKSKTDTSWPTAWNYVDAGSVQDGTFVERGIIIHNAVFAGGNIGVGSELYANTKTVFGNATATIHDVYNRDLITIGAIHIGGLYGDGNLTFVDGYRELNVTNYGTDYHNIKDEINYTEYQNLPPREQAYYELKYKCLQECEDNEGTKYTVGSTIARDELLVLFYGKTNIINEDGTPNSDYWTENGVVSRYAGRYLNTIQRADFCGVFGSRLVMKGAKDRVPEVADNTNYTINRVREVSLNKKASIATTDAGTAYATHGNYFGIYSVVNHLGALTSDLDFYNAVRTTDNKDESKYKTPTANGKAYGTATYADWKEQFHKDPRRNNGSSHNEVALASGVYLELTTEKSTGNTLETKDWGIITGVVQLDLINVAKGIGGGFVYAKNIHGVRQPTGKTHTILTDLNKTGGVNGVAAVTNKSWTYIETGGSGEQEEWQTSGNFIHNSQIIIDDCYNVSGRYQWGDSKRVPAHYWYIRGSVYVYDQYITAHTGSPTAYSKNVELPITIFAASHNQMKLMDVKPNLYAYYSSYNTSNNTGTKLGNEQKLMINEVEYNLNTPISYWDWYLLSASEKKLFVKETYVTSAKCKIGNTIYPAGMVMLPDSLAYYEANTTEQTIDGKTVKAVLKVVQDEDGHDVVAKDNDGNDIYVPFTSVFHSSNEMSHETGFLMTAKMTNPGLWDTWYTSITDRSDKKQVPGTGYEDGPTYSPTASGLYGQKEYKVADIIPKEIITAYEALGSNKPTPDDQASFDRAYVVTNECSSATRHYYEGAPVSSSEASALGAGNAAEAYVCTGTIQLSATEYIFINDLMTADQKNALMTTYSTLATDIDKLVVPAYYCTTAGLYGGSYYEANKNYRALEAYSSMAPTNRSQFKFNYDALDLLIDKDYGHTEGQKYQYDSAAGTLGGAQANPAQYSLATPIDYTATYDGESGLDAGKTVHVTHASGEGADVTTIAKGDVLTRDVYESLLNEQHHYAPIDVTDENKNNPFYVANTAFYDKEPFAAGQVIDAETYGALSEEMKDSVDQLNFSTMAAGIYYYCRESYTIDSNGTAVTAINSSTPISTAVPAGTIINATEYGKLKNKQLGFTIHGVSPTETTTLYVSSDANYDALTKEKIITVIYQYDYEESDESGAHITPISERHVLRIHVTFENGIPTVENIQEPDIVLPGTSITMRVPGVTSNGYEIIGGGWELFENQADAESHFSGVEYSPNIDPLYWYQDDFYLAYYAKTYNRGKTYSNAVPVHVANYHDLKAVMDDKANHLHVDYDRTRLKRDSKIYINDYSSTSENGLDMLKSFYDLSVLDGSSFVTDANGLITSGTFAGHKPLNNSVATGTNIYDQQTYTKGVKGATNLEFFLRTDIDHTGSAWTPMGTDDQCFKGTLHGDGHTISGLSNSLFYNLCGNVYNLGVTGSFQSAGVVDKGIGYVESCWTKTSATEALDPKPNAVFGAPSDDNGYQLVNSYFYEGNKDLYKTTTTDGITTSGGERGKATAKTEKAYYDGELAYDLNNFYLYKRYSDKLLTTGTDAQKYRYFTIDDDGNLVLKSNNYYEKHAEFCSTGTGTDYEEKYVENRFADGDFRYAAGEVPTSEDERYYEEIANQGTDNETVVSTGFYPIYPDDYIFFGQKLTYGYNSHLHQDVPTAVVRDGGRLSLNDDANRVYRAPAYFRSKEMGAIHFNPIVYLAAKEKLTDKQIAASVTARDAYPGLTAIDFAGHQEGHAVSAYKLGRTGNWFYQPLLDDDGLTSITNCDETKNLLVYAPAETATSGYANKKTYDVLTGYFVDPEYGTYYDNTDNYRLVTKCDENVNGHLVQSNLTATNDHLLIDKQDFNAPIAYTFDASHRMWYQRTPDTREFVDRKKGWQGISLPFSAELVTTHQKGEITHFYSGSESSKNNTGTKIGHEYWLRNLTDIAMDNNNSKAVANFVYPTATGTDTKTVTNTFLWDYYYSKEVRKDKNSDEYQEYYSGNRTYDSYPMLTAATPYILGFPGQTYYEFDLSGNFVPQNTYSAISKLDKQTFTFASNTGIGIGVSDDETKGVVKATSSSGKSYTFTFKPSYMNMSLEAGSDNYTLDADGDSYDKVPDTGDATTVSAFRPYFLTNVTSNSREFMPESILFSNISDEFSEEEREDLGDGALFITSRLNHIIVRSTLKKPRVVTIHDLGGIRLTTFTIEPGQTIETRVNIPGVYVVNKTKIKVR